jgi:hypothetical protein
VSIDILTGYLEQTPHDLESVWDYAAVTGLAMRGLPSQVLGDQEPLLKGDQHRLWLRWFLEGLISPRLAAKDAKLGRLEVLEMALKRISSLYQDVEVDRQKRLAQAITNHVMATVDIIRSASGRDTATTATRHALIAGGARCYICGYAFSKEAVDAFLRVNGRSAIKLPSLVDVFRPRGLKVRDESIEIEHFVPAAAGGSGQANLRLACGWCNKYKSARTSIYETAFIPSHTATYKIAGTVLTELPNPFWTIRLLALRGKCQHKAGCANTAANAEMFVTLADWSGSPNPTNLKVYCEMHDPIRVDRMQARDDVEALWLGRKQR